MYGCLDVVHKTAGCGWSGWTEVWQGHGPAHRTTPTFSPPSALLSALPLLQAFSPSVDLTRIRTWAEFNRIITGFIQVGGHCQDSAAMGSGISSHLPAPTRLPSDLWCTTRARTRIRPISPPHLNLPPAHPLPTPQVALLTRRIPLFPDIPCEAPFLHNR